MAQREWLTKAQDAAMDMFEEFRDQMLEQLIESGEASTDLNNDYSGGDRYHHESNVDASYDLTEAAAILDELHEFEETDIGLWEGLQPRDAISAQAAYTYGNAVYSFWRMEVESLNREIDGMEFADDDDRARVLSWWLPAKWVLDGLDVKECGGLVAGVAADHAKCEWTGFPPLADWMEEHPNESSSYKLAEVRKVIALAEQAARDAEEADLADTLDADDE